MRSLMKIRNCFGRKLRKIGWIRDLNARIKGEDRVHLRGKGSREVSLWTFNEWEDRKGKY